jgi:pyridoxine 5-phosphate synthase
MVKLGVNIDHVATVREARKTFEPDPVKAALETERAGCDGIVCHLRKDRRHIQDADLFKLREVIECNLNMEMCIDPEIVDIACSLKPDQATIVPENRQEVTTEGGLDVAGNLKNITRVVETLKGAGIKVSLFIDPEPEQVEASLASGVEMIEFHTGRYAEAFHREGDSEAELRKIAGLTVLGADKGLTVAAGHGLTYQNVKPIARIPGIYELNIGHSIVSRAVFVGISEAVRQMKDLIR